MINHFRGEYGFLSNTAEANIPYKGHNFPSTENAYMWEKSPEATVKDEDGNDISWLDFCLTREPNIVKKKSREVPLRKDWNDFKLHLMYHLLTIKFSQEPFRSKLLATELQNIVEGNFWNDTFWGVDLKTTPNEGENWLGRLLMDVRQKLRKNQ